MQQHRHWPKELIIIIHNEEILRAAVNQAAVAPRRNRKGKGFKIMAGHGGRSREGNTAPQLRCHRSPRAFIDAEGMNAVLSLFCVEESEIAMGWRNILERRKTLSRY